MSNDRRVTRDARISVDQSALRSAIELHISRMLVEFQDSEEELPPVILSVCVDGVAADYNVIFIAHNRDDGSMMVALAAIVELDEWQVGERSNRMQYIVARRASFFSGDRPFEADQRLYMCEQPGALFAIELTQWPPRSTQL